MKRNQINPSPIWIWARVATASLFILPLPLQAQEEEEETEIQELSPFEVTSDADFGYVADSTMAGSRLNSKLGDVPAVINVFTQEFIDDVAANDLMELVLYDSNVQEHNFEDQGAVNSGTFNSSDPNQRNNFRSRGLDSVFSRDFYNWYAPQDNYNVSRVDFSKGPNGVLFGVGATGGILNSTTDRANVRNTFGRLDAQVGSFNLYRAGFDWNQVILEDQLALRLNILGHTQDGHRYHTFRDKERFTLSGTFKPFKTTTLRAFFEGGTEKRSNQRPFGVQDNVSEWVAAGRPEVAYNNGRAVAQGTNGIGTRNGNARLAFYDDGLYNWARSGTSTAFNDLRNADPFRANYVGRRFYDDQALFGELSTSNKIAAGGPDTWVDTDFRNFSIQWEQRILNNIQMELSYFNDKIENYGQNPGGNNLDGDVNPLISDGTGNRPFNNPLGPNPNVGNVFIENVWRTDQVDKNKDAFRALLAMDLDLDRLFGVDWMEHLGTHRIAGMYEIQEEHIVRENTFEVMGFAARDAGLIQGLNRTNAENGRNRIFRRNYVTFGDWESFHTGRFPTDHSVFIPQIGETATTTFVPTGRNAISDDYLDSDAYMFAVQSFFLRNRLVTTFGYRSDNLTIDQATSVRDNPNETGGPADIDGDGEQYEWVLLRDQRNITEASGITRTMGGVFHLTDMFSVFYNRSSGIRPAAVNNQVAPDGLIAPPVEGKTQDYGIGFQFLDGRISGRLVRYDTDQKNRFFFQTAGIHTMSNNVLEILERTVDSNGNPLVSASDIDEHTPAFNGALGDAESEGYEFRLIGDATKNLRVAFNYSYTDRKISNVLNDLESYLEDEVDFFNARLAIVGSDINSTATPDGQSLLSESRNPPETIAEEVGRVNSAIIRQRAIREFGFGENPHKFSSTLTYRFTDGTLKGFTAGTTLRYHTATQMETLIDYDDRNNNFRIDNGEPNLDADGNLVQLGTITGESKFFLDLMARYSFRPAFLGGDIRTDLQLNVFNALDDDDVSPQRLTDSLMAVRQYTYTQPRSFRLTLRVHF